MLLRFNQTYQSHLCIHNTGGFLTSMWYHTITLASDDQRSLRNRTLVRLHRMVVWLNMNDSNIRQIWILKKNNQIWPSFLCSCWTFSISTPTIRFFEICEKIEIYQNLYQNRDFSKICQNRNFSKISLKSKLFENFHQNRIVSKIWPKPKKIEFFENFCQNRIFFSKIWLKSKFFEIFELI